MYFVQQIREYVNKMSHKLTISLVSICLMFLLLMLTVLHQSSRIQQLEKRSIQEEVKQPKKSDSDEEEISKKRYLAGSLYTRWGRTTCTPGLSDRVYTGIAGGQHYEHSGGASNILCLPMDPLWGNFTSAFEDSATIYGSEYQVYTNDHTMFSDANAKALVDHDIPCTVCQTKAPAAIFMLPARNRCYPGWTLEYSGYLMSARYDFNGRSEYLCIDKDPEADPAGFRDDNGAIFYPVQGVCGSLPCPPYIRGQELTCAVCSKKQVTIQYELRHQEIV